MSLPPQPQPAGRGSPRATSLTLRTRRRPPRNQSPSVRPCQSTCFPVAADHRGQVHPRRLTTGTQRVAPSTCSKLHHVIHTEDTLMSVDFLACSSRSPHAHRPAARTEFAFAAPVGLGHPYVYYILY